MASSKDNLIEELTLGSVAELAPGEVVIGVLDGLSIKGEPLVDFQQNNASESIPAMSTLAINPEHIGRQVALLFTEGNLSSPLIIGFIHSPLLEMVESFSSPEAADAEADSSTSKPALSQQKTPDAYVDGRRVVLEGHEEVVLRCGEASITLTKAGKIMIRGKYILNRSTGVNRILGGSVQVN